MKFKSKTLFSLLASCTMVFTMSGAYAADPLYQWNFNGADGANSGTGTDGALIANVGGATTASFTQTGVSGEAWDHSLNTSNAFANYWGTDVGNAAAMANLDLSTLNQFTITMWIKRGGGNVPSFFNIGDTPTPDAASNPGISMGFDWGNNLRFGVKGFNGWTGDLWGAGSNNDQWVFLAVAYDGNGAVWYDETMNNLYGQHRNAVVITGDQINAVTVAAGLAMHIGDWGTAVGSPGLGTTATAFLANNGSNTTGFSGNLDDVRIYSGLLTVPEIEAVRQSAFAEPSPAVDLYWKGDVDDSWASLNWTSDIDGLVPGGALATDGSQGIAFATTGATNLLTVLNADQNVKNIVVTPGAPATDIGGSHSLTIGAEGIWVEQSAGSLFINPSGGVILDLDQTWKNKSANPLIVDSAISGAGKLTKGGTGPLRLGGDNSAHAGGTVVELGTLALDHPNALGSASASLAMNSGTLDLNGNSITLGALSGNASATIHNTSGTACSLTLDVTSNNTYSCKINDGPGGVPVSLVKKGSASVTSNSAGNFTGPVSIEDGQFIATQPNWGAPNSGSLGNAQVPGRTVTVTSPGSLALNNNNIFGNNFGDLSKLPEIIVNETTVSATNFNLIGDISLNASTLSNSTTNTGNYQGYQFKGIIRVTGTTGASTISGSGGNHLSSNTVFEVEDVTGDALEDLSVSTPLINQSGDFALAPGGLAKTGAGTLILQAANTYSGGTTIDNGTLSVWSPTFADTSTIAIALGAILNLDTTAATDVVGGLEIDGISQPDGIYGAIGSGAEHETASITGDGFLQVIAPGYSFWAGTNAGAQTPGEDFNNDGVDNGIAYFMNDSGVISLPVVVGGVITWPNGGSIPAAQYGTEFVVQTSQDLATWTDVPSGSLSANTDGPAGSLSYTLPTGQGKWFVRLVVTPQ